MINLLTVDVEDYFQVEAFKQHVERATWNDFPVRVEQNTSVILDLLARQNIKGTFFILGWVAEKYPGLVKKIHSQGHEVASHGYDHQLIYTQKPDEFLEETKKSKTLLEELIGVEVCGYRAATFSITRESLWALELLVEAGFKYDSSIYPGRHDRYGIPGSPTHPYIINTAGSELVEFPISVLPLGKTVLPVAGGGYFRLFPYWFSRWAYQKINAAAKPVMFYIHPWEVDPQQPKIEGINLATRFRHYVNLSRCEHKLNLLVDDFKFGRVCDLLDQMAITDRLNLTELRQLGC